MINISVKRDEIKKSIVEIVKNIKEPLYRGLGEIAEKDYLKRGKLILYEGNMSVGRGVFFSNDIGYALKFAKNYLLITSREIIDPENKVIDTRIKGYDEKIREKLGEISGWGLWQEIQKYDTITVESNSGYVYTCREEMDSDKLIYEIKLNN